MSRVESFSTFAAGIAVAALMGILTGLTPELLRFPRLVSAALFLASSCLLYFAGHYAGRAAEAHAVSLPEDAARLGSFATKLLSLGALAGLAASALVVVDVALAPRGPSEPKGF